ncbi:MAG: DUF1810 domain-containing protein [Rhizobiaceae bacterium]|nr:DUF1810 domain-containing protein [Rhizobiaceae bacterium]MCV0406636.1 DUF1810 domain-containing protein [Rhizobiaceae bacterium]
MAGDPFDLDRFVKAQDGVVERARAELRAGRKQSHWMWFVFPQLAGLGSSAMARRYAIASLDEARAYLAHPLLGPRLRAGVEDALASGETDAHRLFGSPDDMKFRSCLTLFIEAGGEGVFEIALEHFFGGEADAATLSLLKR